MNTVRLLGKYHTGLHYVFYSALQYIFCVGLGVEYEIWGAPVYNILFA